MHAPEIFLTTLISAWLFFLVMNARDLKTLIKRRDQRTDEEQLQVCRGLLRLFLVEMLVMVPASAALILLLLPAFTHNVSALDVLAKGSERDEIALYAMMGIVSYGFPFATIRERLGTAIQAALVGSTNHPTPDAKLDTRRRDT